jgi:hypothetical protein
MSDTPAAGTLSSAYSIVPTTEVPYQSISITLAGQSCLINFYTKSTNIAVQAPLEIGTDPTPRYENINPCFLDLYVAGKLILGGILARQGQLLIRDTYLGFSGDLAVIDTSGAGQDPYGVPPRLPPLALRNAAQVAMFPLSDGDEAPASIAGTIPGMGTRFILTYWPVGSYTPGYTIPEGI